jgi:hypothetical protein
MKKRDGFMELMVWPLEKSLFTITTKKEEAIVTVFMDWFNNTAALKQVPDLQQRLMQMPIKLRKMAKNLKISIHEGKLVIKTDADSETLLSLLRRGSDWFEPHPDVDAAILVGLSTSK